MNAKHSTKRRTFMLRASAAAVTLLLAQGFAIAGEAVQASDRDAPQYRDAEQDVRLTKNEARDKPEPDRRTAPAEPDCNDPTAAAPAAPAGGGSK